jgi:hypothetical protein
MIRDFWNVSLPTLHREIEAIKDRCEPDLYQAMLDLKSIANISAQPERDVALIVDIDDGDAEQLLNLIHELNLAWYVVRAMRRDRVEAMRKMAVGKKAQQSTATPTELDEAP